MPFVPTSVMHQDIGPHECEMTIYDGYEKWAVCNLCGKHDWDDDLDKKYPAAKIVDCTTFTDEEDE